MNPAARVRLGRTHVYLTRLGLGTAPLAGLFRATDAALAAETLERAYDLGVRYFDTAPLYGSGLAEERLGRALLSPRLAPHQRLEDIFYCAAALRIAAAWLRVMIERFAKPKFWD